MMSALRMGLADVEREVRGHYLKVNQSQMWKGFKGLKTGLTFSMDGLFLQRHLFMTIVLFERSSFKPLICEDDTFVIDEVVLILCLDGLKDRVGNDVDVILVVLAYITAAREIEPKIC